MTGGVETSSGVEGEELERAKALALAPETAQ